ncbi:MAG TPA: hypothetical protein EYG93_06145 [Sulfurospirillum arcachonense]|nr:hypothetical protein [Sulfurospirillum arcachonense]
MNENRRYIEEDEIDLVELFRTLVKRKWFIIMFTCIVTLGAIVFAYMKTPVYEVRALVEIGSYKTDNSNVLLDNATQLTKKLNVIFIDIFKNDKDRKASISSIVIPKKTTSFIEIKSESTSNELAIDEIKKVVDYIQTKHKRVLKDIKKNRELEINNITKQIENIKTKELAFLDEEISLTKINFDKYREDLNAIKEEIKLQKKSNPTFAALSLTEKRDLNTQIRIVEKNILKLKVQKNRLLTTGVNKLVERKNKLESMLQPYNYKNSEIVGKIITNDYPIKPKKKLIVVVAFVTGLILAIFLVFFMEFIQNIKRKEEEQ